MYKLGCIIRSARLKKDMTTQQLAYLVNEKLSRNYISYIELYDIVPSPIILAKIIDLLGLDREFTIEVAIATKLHKCESILRKKYR